MPHFNVCRYRGTQIFEETSGRANKLVSPVALASPPERPRLPESSPEAGRHWCPLCHDWSYRQDMLALIAEMRRSKSPGNT